MTQPVFVPLFKGPSWLPFGRKKFNFYPCHIEKTLFQMAIELFGATASRLKATQTAPRAGQHFLLRLASGRHALVTKYDDFPESIEVSLELTETDEGEEVAYMADLMEVLAPLGCPRPDKSRVGFPVWR